MADNGAGRAWKTITWLTVLIFVAVLLAWRLNTTQAQPDQSTVTQSSAADAPFSEAPDHASPVVTQAAESRLQETTDQAETAFVVPSTQEIDVQRRASVVSEIPVDHAPQGDAAEAAQVEPAAPVAELPPWAATMIADQDIAQQEVFAEVLDHHRQQYPTF